MFKKIAIYVRVSTDEQRDRGHSMTAQLTGAKKRALDLYSENALIEIYDDGGYSAKNFDRPAIKRLISDITNNEIETVIFSSLDRISRNLMDLQYFLHHTETYGCSLECITQEVKYHTPEEKMFVLMQGIVAQYELDKVSQRTKAGLSGGLQKGFYIFSTPPYGYSLIDKRLIVNIDRAECVNQIYNLYVNKAWSVQQIQKHLQAFNPETESKWSYNKVYNILKNTAYIGYISYQDTKHYISPIILDQQLWENAQRKLIGGEFTRKGQSKHTYLFKNKIICNACKKPLTGQSTVKKTKTYLYYFCNNKNCSCYRKRILEQKIQEPLLEELVKLSLNFVKQAKQNILKKLQIDTTCKKLDKDIKLRHERLLKVNLMYLEKELAEKEFQDLKRRLHVEIQYFEQEKQLQLDLVNDSVEFINLTVEDKHHFINKHLAPKKFCLLSKSFVQD